jgi:hypothetical protein
MLLQKQIDARRREFRDVRWEAHMGPDQAAPENWRFHLTNTGLTTACDVTLVVQLEADELHSCGDLAPGDSIDIHLMKAPEWHATQKPRLPVTPGHVIHWSSPAGESDEVIVEPVLLLG